jgi:hypothetical protein
VGFFVLGECWDLRCFAKRIGIGARGSVKFWVDLVVSYVVGGGGGAVCVSFRAFGVEILVSMGV